MPSAIARAIGVRESAGQPAARGGRGPPRGNRSAPLPRQPRASCRGRRSRRRAARPRARSPGARDEPNAAPPLDRARASRSSRSRSTTRRRSSSSSPRRAASSCTTTRSPRCTRSAAGSTACRSRSSSSPLDSPFFHRGDRARARGRARARDGRTGRPPGAAADAPRGDRLELPAPDREPARAPRRARGVRDSASLDDARVSRARAGDVSAGPRGARRLEPHPQRVGRRRAASLDARDGSRARARPSGAGRRCSTTLRRRHAERFLELALAAEDELAGPTRRRGSSDSSGSSTTSRRHSTGCLTAGRAEDALRATAALERFWRAHGHVIGGTPLARRSDSSSRATSRPRYAPTRSGQRPARRPLRATGARRRHCSTRRFRSFARAVAHVEVAFTLSELGFVARTPGRLRSRRRASAKRRSPWLASSTTTARRLGRAHDLGGVDSLQGDHQSALAHVRGGRRAAPCARRPAARRSMPSTTSDGRVPRRGLRPGPSCVRRVARDRARRSATHCTPRQALVMLAELDLFDGDVERSRASTSARASTLYTELEDDRLARALLVVLAPRCRGAS